MVNQTLKRLKVGQSATITIKGGRRVTFKRVRMTGFPQFRIMSNKKRK